MFLSHSSCASFHCLITSYLFNLWHYYRRIVFFSGFFVFCFHTPMWLVLSYHFGVFLRNCFYWVIPQLLNYDLSVSISGFFHRKQLFGYLGIYCILPYNTICIGTNSRKCMNFFTGRFANIISKSSLLKRNI